MTGQSRFLLEGILIGVFIYIANCISLPIAFELSVAIATISKGHPWIGIASFELDFILLIWGAIFLMVPSILSGFVVQISRWYKVNHKNSLITLVIILMACLIKITGIIYLFKSRSSLQEDNLFLGTMIVFDLILFINFGIVGSIEVSNGSRNLD